MTDLAIAVIGIAIMLTFTVGLVQMLRWVASLFSPAPEANRISPASAVDATGRQTINWSPARAIGYVIFAGFLGLSIGRASVSESQANAANPPAVGAMEAIGAAEAAATPPPLSLLDNDVPSDATEEWAYADTYYANCSEARASGAAPVREGDPGYAPHLDRDNDGVGCE